MNNTVFVDMEETCEAPAWFTNVEPFVQKALDTLEISNWELSVLFCADPFIAELNKQYRNVDGPTDVLSFEQGDEYIDDEGATWFTAGDIVISIDTLASNSREFGVTQNEELKRLLVHGILHLSGMDHSDNESTQPMLLKQESVLALLQNEVVIE